MGYFTRDLVFPIVQSYKFKSKSQLSEDVFTDFLGVSDSSKLQIQKQITTDFIRVQKGKKVFPIVQSYKFKSKSQLVIKKSSYIHWCFR